MASKDDNYRMSLRDAVEAALSGRALISAQGSYLNKLLADMGLDIVIPELHDYGDGGEGPPPDYSLQAVPKEYRDAALAKIDPTLEIVGLPAQDAQGQQIYRQQVVGADGTVRANIDSGWEDPGGFEQAMPYIMAGILGAGFVAAAGGAGAGAGASGAGTAGAGAAGGGAFALPVAAGGVGPVGSAGWSSLGAASGGAVAGGAGLAAAGGGGAGTGIVGGVTAGGAATGATNAALIDSALGTAGYGASSAGLGGGAGTLAAGGLFGTGITGGQLASGLGAAGQLIGGIKGFSDAADLKSAGTAADPFAGYRAGYADMLQKLMADPSSVTTLPGYQFGLDESDKMLTRNLASQGLTGSGTAAKAIAHNASDYAGKFYQQQLQTLAGLGGANINNAGLSLQAQSAGSSLENQSINNLAKLIPTVAGWFGGGS